jgi:hypothetical protein
MSLARVIGGKILARIRNQNNRHAASHQNSLGIYLSSEKCNRSGAWDRFALATSQRFLQGEQAFANDWGIDFHRSFR